jgi:predicted nucleic acid-binding protein
VKRVLFDSDVLLDVLDKREPHFQASVQALNTVKTGKTQGYISGHAVTNIYYISELPPIHIYYNSRKPLSINGCNPLTFLNVPM